MILSILAMLFTMLLTIVLPIGVMIVLHKKGGKWSTFFIGVAIFIIFAMILESILHSLIFMSPLGKTLQANLWLYALYGGLTAGLFEETGRFLAFRYFLKNQKEPLTALSYGIGHGGAEAILLTGITMLANLVVLLLVMSGVDFPSAFKEVADNLLTSSPVLYLWSGVERITAIIVHLANSVFVFAAANGYGKPWLFYAAIGVHATVNILTVIASSFLPVSLTEILALLATLLIAYCAIKVYRSMQAQMA